MNANPLISVVIPCHGGVADTRASLQALLDQRDSSPLELILVDNASPDGTRDLDREFPGVRVVRQETNLGFAGGVNAGLAIARGDRCLILNNDTVPAPHMVARLEHALDSDPRVGIVGPVSNRVKGAARLDVGDGGCSAEGAREIETLLEESAHHAVLQDVETLSGLCMLFRRELLDRIGDFDTRFGAGMYEDDDFCLRARLLGLRLVVARTAFVHHHGHKTFRRLGHDVTETMLERQRCFREKWCDHDAGKVYIARLDCQHDAASEHARSAVRSHPDWPDGHLVLAEAARRARDFPAMRQHAERFVASTPTHGRGRCLLGIALLGSGESQAGLDTFRDALAHCYFTPDEIADNLADLGRYFVETGEPDAAVRHLRDAHEIDPEHAGHMNLLGLCELERGDYTAAMPLLERAAATGDPAAHNNLGICAWRSGDHARALSEFEAAVEMVPEDASFHANLQAAREATNVDSAAPRR